MGGRLHLPEITDKYKKRMKLSIDKEINEKWSKQDNNDDLNGQKIKTDETGIKRIEISSNYIKSFFIDSNQNDLAAIAAVDYAIKERKPTCGFAMEFKMAFKV